MWAAVPVATVLLALPLGALVVYAVVADDERPMRRLVALVGALRGP